MGHNWLPKLPSSRSWQDVVALMQADAPPTQVIAQAAQAAQGTFANAVDDPVYAEAVRLLIVIAQAGRSDAFGPTLAQEGLGSTAATSLPDLLAAVSDRLDSIAQTNPGNSDVGVLARRALLSSLLDSLESRMPGLFSEQSGDLALAVRPFSAPAGFSELARAFFTRMSSETLAYWLDRTASAQIGRHQSFADLGDRNAFDAALHQFSAEATRIIREFSAGWYAKNIGPGDRVQEVLTRKFAAVAFKKINAELARKTGDD